MDADYFFAMENLLKRLDLPFYFCEESKQGWIKIVNKYWHQALKIFGYKARTADTRRLLESLACQARPNGTDPSYQLQRHGVMSATLSGQAPEAKLTQLAVSFLASLSFAEDHLHSSWTLYHPAYESILTIDQAVLPLLAAIVYLAYPLLYSYYMRSEEFELSPRPPLGTVAVAAAAGLVVGGWPLAAAGAGLGASIANNGRLDPAQVRFWVLLH